MICPYKPGDRVLTKIEGEEVEVFIAKVTIDLEVVAPDGKRYWRAIGRLKSIVESAESGDVQPSVKAPEGSDETTAAEATGAVETSTHPESEGNALGDTPPVPETGSTPPLAEQLAAPAPEQLPCGVPETMSERKRNKKRKGRR